MKIQFVSDLHLEFPENRAYLAEHPLDVTGDASTVDVNAWEQHTYGCLNHVTLYPSPYMVLTEQGYTNVTEVESRASSLALPRCSNVTERTHYFEEGRRICSKLGGGFLRRVAEDEIHKPVKEVKYNYEEQHNQQRQGVHETFGKCIGAWPELIKRYDLLRMILEYRSEEEPAFFYHSDLCASREQSQACLSYAEMQQSVQSNHLGSAAYLTSGGHVTQTLNYLPYGEDWIDVQNNMDPRLGKRAPYNIIEEPGNRVF